MPFVRYGGRDSATFGNFNDVVPQRLSHCVQGQRAVDESLNEFEAAHRPLPISIYNAKVLLDSEFHHEPNPEPASAVNVRIIASEPRSIIALQLSAKVSGRISLIQTTRLPRSWGSTWAEAW